MAFNFCPQCGTAVEPGGRFCTGCGGPLAAAGASSGASLAGLVSLVALLVLGGGFWLYFRLAPTPDRPLKPGEGRTATAPPPGAPPSAGRGHPPVELPEDVKQFMANLAKQAEAKPKDVAVWQQLGGVYYRASRLDPTYAAKAEQAFTHLVQVDAKNLDGLRGLGNLAFDRQDRPGAIEHYRRFLEIKPDDPEVRTDLGTMLFESGESEKALAEYEQVIDKNPSFYQAYFNLAVVYDAQGDRPRARASLEKARDLATDADVKQRLTALLAASADGRPLAQAANAMAGDIPVPGGDDDGEEGAPAREPGTQPAPGAAPGAKAEATFPASVEQLFRQHPITGAKVVRIDWPTPEQARVVLSGFPVQTMPEAMRDSYLAKMRGGIGEAKQRFAVTGAVSVELVDHSTGEVMATITP